MATIAIVLNVVLVAFVVVGMLALLGWGIVSDRTARVRRTRRRPAPAYAHSHRPGRWAASPQS